MYIIPTKPAPNQTFICNIPLNGGNVRFKFFLTYNLAAGYWMATMTNMATGEEEFSNLPLLCSEHNFADILSQMAYKHIGKCYILNNNNSQVSMPGEDNLGIDYLMLWEDNNG